MFQSEMPYWFKIYIFFNGVSNQKQLDVYLIYFDEYLQRTQRLYFNALFMDHAQAFDMIQSRH